MIWNIIAFESKRGEKFVEKFITSLEPPTIAKVTHVIDLLEKHGSLLGMPHAKRIASKLHELRIRGKQEVRIIYAIVGRRIYLLHAFKKQTQKTPPKEMVTAVKRLTEIP